VDYAWLRMDDPTNLMMINGVLVMEGPVDLGRLREVMVKRLLPIPRFRQRVATPPKGGWPRWEADPDFDIDHHLTPVTLPEPGDDAELRAVIEGLASAPLDPTRPLWHFHAIANYRGGTVLFGRLHHAIGDGVALMLVLLSITDLDAEPEAGHEHPNPFTALLGRTGLSLAAVRELAEQIMPDGMRLLLQPVEAFKKAGRWMTGLASVGALGRLLLRPADPKTPFKGPLGVPKKVAWSEPIPVAEVKALGKAMGATINDVLLAAMAGGLRRYLDRHQSPAEDLNFRAAMPVNLRPLDQMADLGNHFGLVFLSLPVGIDDPLLRLQELRRRATALKRSVEPVVVFRILEAMGLTPIRIQRWVVSIFATKATAVATNIPGPREVLYLAGRPIRDIFFWVPQAGRVGVGISICSYAGRIRLGVGTDAGLVPDPEVIVEGFHAELEEMRRRVSPVRD
jgi:WS/DGAT/MGAT family acyltransferase